MGAVPPQPCRVAGRRRRAALMLVARMLAALMFAALILGRSAEEARASAWNVLSGQGFADIDVTLDGGDRYFDKNGRLLPARPYRSVEGGGYIEYGITDWLMAVARPSFDLTRVGSPDGGHYLGPGATQAGLQYQVLLFGPAALAVQGSFRLPGTTSHQDPAEVGDTAREGDFRALGGVNFPIGPFPAFAELQAAYRIRSDGGASQWHGDATVGVTLTPNLLVLVQSFNQVPVGNGTPYLPSATYSDLKVSLVRRITAAWSLQLGAYLTLAGRNALREEGAVIGVWHRF